MLSLAHLDIRKSEVLESLCAASIDQLEDF